MVDLTDEEDVERMIEEDDRVLLLKLIVNETSEVAGEKRGIVMKVREAESKDAEKLAELIKEVDDTSDYMLWEPGERNIQIDQQAKMINDMKRASNSTVLVAENAGELAGYLFAIGGKAERSRHTAYLVIGIAEDFRGKGVGTKLIEALEDWAVRQQIHRLELTVVTKNHSGLALYKKRGFEIEGTKRDSLKIGGEYIDEYYMVKLL